MPTLYLVLVWIVLGLAMGALALAAQSAWRGPGWLWMLLLGAGSAFLGGLLGALVFGRIFATATALWVAVLVTCVPWLFTRLRARQTRHP